MIENLLLAFQIIDFLLILSIKSREIVALHAPPSETTKKLVDEKDIKKTKSYNKTKMYFSISKLCFSLVKTLFIIGYRLFPRIYNDYFSKMPQSDLIFLLSYTHVTNLIDLPFEIISVFYIEAVYNFNNTTVGTFVFDFFKSGLLTTVLSSIVWKASEKIITIFKGNFYIYLWLFLVLFQVLLIVIYPTIICPLFNKFEDMKESDLKKRITEMAEKQGFKADKILVMDASKRSGHSNAYFIGFGGKKRIVLYDTLLKQMDDDEVVAILGHELGHWKMNHIYYNLLLSSVVCFIYTYLFNMILISPYLKKELFYDCKSLFVKTMYFFYIFEIFSHPITLVSNAFSRANEREADRFAVSLGFGENLINGLIKLFKENSSHMDPDPVYSIFVNTHPTLTERIKLIREELDKNK